MKNFKNIGRKHQGGWVGAAIAAAGALGGGLISKSGATNANQANARLAKQNRDWQKMMSDSAYSRAARDLESAGLNRILALGGPASTPAGNVAQMQNAAAPLGQGVSNAAMNAAQIGLIKAQTAKTAAETDAIAPKEAIGELVINAKERAPLLRDQFFQGTEKIIDKAITKRGESAKSTKVLKERQNRMTRIAKELGIDTKLLLDAMIGMDQINPQWTDEQKLDWAVRNPEAVKRYLKRKR